MAGSPTIVSFAAPSGTGKTTLICAVIEVLKARGHRVGAIKSDAHRVELDTSGKDTHRMRESGAETTALVCRDQIAIFQAAPARETRLDEIVALFFSELELVLAEGFRSHGHPTVLMTRSSVSSPGWKRPGNVVALVSDEPQQGLPWFHLDDVDGIASFVAGLSRGAQASAKGATGATAKAALERQ